MFENVGKKIKVIAKVLFWVNIIGTAVIWMLAMFIGIINADESTLIVGLSTVILLPFSLLWNYVIYGFGQLVENTDRLVEKGSEEE